MPNPRPCGCRERMLARLFGAAASVTAAPPVWSSMALAVLLGIAEEHAILILRLGLIDESVGLTDDEVQLSTATVREFLERDGEWLAKLRVQRQIASLRLLEHTTPKPKARARQRSPAGGRK